MATHDATSSPAIDRWTLIGLSLLLLPLLTMAHQLGRHFVLLVAGTVVTLASAVVLGPTLYLR